LHTADWHLGLRLYKKDIYEEHRFFFSWLLDLIREREIDVLMISGDVFDQANPSNEARALYYEFLVQLIQRKCKVIITGGNHDSPGILNAPKEILEMLEVYVIGSSSALVTEEIIDLGKVVIAAVPYLREPDIHALTKGIAYDDRRQQVRDGIRRHYDLVAEACASYDAPVIAMGHLYAAGSSTTDSERLIQMGNQSAVGADDFSSRFNYVALGHIHRPQIVNGQQHIRYSGSPVPLSFSERDDRKIVIELEVQGNEIVQTDHEVPVFRKLVRFKGTLKEIKEQAELYKKTGPAKAFGELQIEEEKMDPAIYADAARFVADWESDYIDIVNYGITVRNDAFSIGEVSEGRDLREIQPLDVINGMMDSGGMSPEDQLLVRNAFLELLGMDDENEEE
jgi:DNA repair protein SbcD/Mre11